MILRHSVHAAGRVLTRGLLHPQWREFAPMSWTYLRLYLFGKRMTERRELRGAARTLEVTDAAELRPLTDYVEHTRRMGKGYGDVVLLAHDAARRPSAGSPRGGA